MGVSVWPDFDYNATGATTLGIVGEPDSSRVDDGGNPLVHLCFDVGTFEGPPVMRSTTKVFGIPLPPGRSSPDRESQAIPPYSYSPPASQR